MSVDINNRYGLNPAHSEVIEACNAIKPCKALDMGCSNGRNALYLSQLGFDVTAVDNNPDAINMLRQIASEENLDNIDARIYDINDAKLTDEYGLIACTVTLMFVNPANVDEVIKNMQSHTQPGGYNLIVCAMDTTEYPCPVPFPFTFQTGQLRSAYEEWELLKYNEDVGTMHNGATLQFATMLARKPAE
ncbi:tellurite resistance methyltransferase TehB [Idiomarina sp. X4]|uniref:tellurite resistance methyltransferase TehB n=1 Tax=Idiomarina sp. X4 TaxID=2055892 RepID=UPI000C286ABA|nr:tellurite resistance methyltransferase TehB [Idiomarina sp. X4]ATZ73595.1 tellurite resistance methyltransferase TehB [Idiomarina sp. X4]